MSALASAPRAQSGNHIGFMQSLRGKLLLYFLLLALVPMITVVC